MGVWFGFPLAFVVCSIAALLGFCHFIPMLLAIIVIIGFVGSCWLYCAQDFLSDMIFSWGYWRKSRKKKDCKEAITGRNWFLRDALLFIFSPILAIVAIIFVGGLVTLWMLLGTAVDKIRNIA